MCRQAWRHHTFRRAVPTGLHYGTFFIWTQFIGKHATALNRAVSRHDLGHRLVMNLNNSRFPEVPTIRLVGFPYLHERLFDAGCVFPLMVAGRGAGG